MACECQRRSVVVESNDGDRRARNAHRGTEKRGNGIHTLPLLLRLDRMQSLVILKGNTARNG